MRVSEDFHVDLNSEYLRSLLRDAQQPGENQTMTRTRFRSRRRNQSHVAGGTPQGTGTLMGKSMSLPEIAEDALADEQPVAMPTAAAAAAAVDQGDAGPTSARKVKL